MKNIRINASDCYKRDRVCDGCKKEHICEILSSKYDLPFIVFRKI